ncbi:MAG: carboxypeptidase-like regulatory domain-containing protein [Bacteroidales bacterium]|nr:carboxypeptidase-like regulatory domain-containing protein [Bacteroidales bacterium]
MMTDIFLYLLKSSLTMSLLYMVYWFFLKKETLFNTSRYYLLLSLVISVVLPFICIRYNVSSPERFAGRDMTGTLTNINNITLHQGARLPLLLRIAGIVYLLGTFLFLSRITIQFAILFGIIYKNGVKIINGTRIVYNTRYQMPFSFMNLVFINKNDTSHNNISDIIAHEKVHIRENHWFDLMVVEIISIFLWFNPFIWFFERSIKQNHEYLADEGVIAQGYNVGRYHSVLINQLMGMEVIGITNNLNYSLNAKRLKMMKKSKTPKLKALHMIWALPVIVFLLAAFAEPRYETVSDADQAAIAKTVKLTVAVMDNNGDPVPGANVIIKGTRKGTTTDKDGLFTLEVSESDVIVVSFKGFEDSPIYMEKLIEKNGKSDSYKMKLMLKPAGSDIYMVVNSPDEIKELENTLKTLELKQKELEEMKKKISQLEQEGNVNKEELEKKKATLKKEWTMVSEKRAAVEKKLQSIKKK